MCQSEKNCQTYLVVGKDAAVEADDESLLQEGLLGLLWCRLRRVRRVRLQPYSDHRTHLIPHYYIWEHGKSKNRNQQTLAFA